MTVPPTAVIVTCYNQERFIRQALDSLAAQTVAPSEIVVIDGHSHDRSVRVIEQWIEQHSLSVELIAHDRNYGLCAALNQGMDAISSPFVLTLYGDDWLEPTRIERQAPILAASGHEVAMAVGMMREVDRRGIPLVEHDYSETLTALSESSAQERLAHLIRRNTIPSPAVLLKSDYVRAVGGYDETLAFDDYDLWLRLLSRWNLTYHQDIVVNYRFLDDSLSRNPDRRGDFLLSEARMVHKHRGISPKIDRLIGNRIASNARLLAGLGDARRFRAAMALLADVSPDQRRVLSRSRLPGGLRAAARLLEGEIA